MRNNEVQNLISEATDRDSDVVGLLVYNFETEAIIATTFSEEHSKKVIAIQKKFYETEEDSLVATEEPAGETNWFMKSVARKIIYEVHINNDVCLFGETKITEAPTAVLEDGLELALMIGRRL